MNHLAHVFLAPDSAEARVGSILGDFTRNVDIETLPRDVRRGVRHHLRVDSFTDRHPQVLASKALFSNQRRRFAGVALDILYDHFLIRHWDRFSGVPREHFIETTYAELRQYQTIMPEPMRRVTESLVAHNWFGAYQDLDNIGHALDRVADRIRFPNRFCGMIGEIRELHPELEQRFLNFFPELQEAAKDF